MRCQHMDDDTQCRFDATRRVLVGGGDPPDPDQSGFAGTVYLVQDLQGARPRSPAVDAAAAPSDVHAHRGTPQALTENP
jgi:hypothetical protein